jgi:hypothetical protein|tara:strand:- start:4719 stop:4904 length:186 start_codon:yes stop_codon:yes gene_type:complete
MSKRSLKDMVLELGDLDITKEEMKQAVEIKKVIDDAMLKKDLELGFEHVVLWWLGSEPADA